MFCWDGDPPTGHRELVGVRTALFAAVRAQQRADLAWREATRKRGNVSAEAMQHLGDLNVADVVLHNAMRAWYRAEGEG